MNLNWVEEEVMNVAEITSAAFSMQPISITEKQFIQLLTSWTSEVGPKTPIVLSMLEYNMDEIMRLQNSENHEEKFLEFFKNHKSTYFLIGFMAIDGVSSSVHKKQMMSLLPKEILQEISKELGEEEFGDVPSMTTQ